MILSPNVNVYLKTTETCNLNCQHCFTSGAQGAKVYFSPEKVISFFQKLKEECPWVQTIRYNFHGGEPMLAPLPDLYQVWNGLKDIFPASVFSIQTNLVYPMTSEKRAFFKDLFLHTGFGTSWDYDIRFGSTVKESKDYESIRLKQIATWEENVRTLVEDGHYLTMIVSITKKLIEEKEPIEIVRYARDLGFKNILFERITTYGNATTNRDIVPHNSQQDVWLHKLFNQTLEHKTYLEIGDMLLSEIAEAYVNHSHVGNRCRKCEQSLLTVNATGTIGGCPNTGPVEHWGHIEWPISESLRSKKRLSQISCEAFYRNQICYTCPAFEYCNSDCNKLPWDDNGTYCAAPKKIWKQMMTENKYEDYQKLILKRSTQEAHAV